MKNNLPNNNVNKWLVLTVVAIFSIAATYAVYKIAMSSAPSNTMVGDKTPTTVATQDEVKGQVTIDTQTNVEEGYVDLYLTSTTPLSIAEYVFTVGSGASFSSIEEGGLFSEYAVQNVNPGEVRIAGVNAGAPSPDVDLTAPAMYARVFVTGLTEDNFVLNVDETSFIDTNNNVVNFTY